MAEEPLYKKPEYKAFTVKDIGKGDEKKGRWLEIGAAWPHKDGEGFDLTLDALPVDGRIVLRKPTPKPSE
jgi:hypothetical protein